MQQLKNYQLRNSQFRTFHISLSIITTVVTSSEVSAKFTYEKKEHSRLAFIYYFNASYIQAL